MSDAPTLITVAAGAIALGAGAVRLAQIAIAKKNGKHKSGDLDPAVWKADIRFIIQEENERLMQAFHALMEARTTILIEKIRDPILADLKLTRHDLRNAIQELVAQAYLRGRK